MSSGDRLFPYLGVFKPHVATDDEYVEERVKYWLEGDRSIQLLESHFRAIKAGGLLTPVRTKVLVSGHRGTGKSTELRRLCRKHSDGLEIIEVPPLNETDAAAEDLFFLFFDALAGRIEGLRKSSHLGTREHTSGLAGAERALKAAVSRLDEADRNSLQLDKKVGLNFFGVFSSEIRLQSGLRAKLREVTQRHLKEWVTDFNVVVNSLQDATSTPVVLVADELDKLKGPSRSAVFGPGLEFVRDLEVAAIITVPIGVCYDPNFSTIQAIPDRVAVSHIKLRNGPGDDGVFAPGSALLGRIARKRVPEDVLPNDVLNRAILLSGGSLDQLGQLLNQALNYAYSMEQDEVRLTDLNFAERTLRHELLRLFGTSEIREQLRDVREQHTRDGLPLMLLEQRAVLEYPNDNPWYDVNPLLIDWVDSADRPPS